MDNARTYKVTIIAPTCFYYQAPLFRSLADDKRIDLTVYFCSNEGVTGIDIKAAYGADTVWTGEDELLAGYKYKFLKNHAPRGSYLKSLVGLANFGIWNELRRERPDVVLVMSWMNPTWWLTFLSCIRLKVPMLFMTDANFYAEQLKSRWKSWLKRNLLGKLVFPLTTGFLYAGTANRMFYTYCGVPDKKLVPFAYSWGYDSLIQKAKRLRSQKSELRRHYGVPQDASVFLYCGRLSPEKGLIELLRAYEKISSAKKSLVLVGDGQLRKQIQDFASERGLQSVFFMGFQNRQQIANFYALADFLVLPSYRETWGIVVNEALCFSLPVVVSDQVGAGVDLVVHNQNGYIFPAGDVLALAERMSDLIELPEDDRLKMVEKSNSIIAEWSNRELGKSLTGYLDSIHEVHA